MRKLDIASWKRRGQYEYFRKMDYPQFNVCFNLDLTAMLPRVKEEGLSFYHAMVYLAARAANGIEEFKYRIRGESVVAHKVVHPSFTFPLDEGGFGFCEARYDEDPWTFLSTAEAALEKAKTRREFGDEENRDDFLFVSCLPWISFTSVSHPVKLGAEDSVPRLTWGKYFKDGDRFKLPFSVQVNHALMDGLQVGEYAVALQGLAEEADGIFAPPT